MIYTSIYTSIPQHLGKKFSLPKLRDISNPRVKFLILLSLNCILYFSDHKPYILLKLVES